MPQKFDDILTSVVKDNHLADTEVSRTGCRVKNSLTE